MQLNDETTQNHEQNPQNQNPDVRVQLNDELNQDGQNHLQNSHKQKEPIQNQAQFIVPYCPPFHPQGHFMQPIHQPALPRISSFLNILADVATLRKKKEDLAKEEEEEKEQPVKEVEKPRRTRRTENL